MMLKHCSLVLFFAWVGGTWTFIQAFSAPPLATTRSHKGVAKRPSQTFGCHLPLQRRIVRPFQLPPLNLGAVEEAIAGVCFPLSLPPYLAFLYFASFDNGMPKLSLAGFKFLLVFVFGSIPAAVLASSEYGVSLADSDWLHGTAEALLTVTNLLIVLGFRNGDGHGGLDVANLESSSSSSSKSIGERSLASSPSNSLVLNSAIFAVFASSLVALVLSGFGGGALASSIQQGAAAVMGPGGGGEHLFMGMSVHTPFLGGVGDIPVAAWMSDEVGLSSLSSSVSGLSTITTTGGGGGEGGGQALASLVGALHLLFQQHAHPEPVNALTVPTWIIHVSSLVEWLAAMGLVWAMAQRSNNERWKGVTWGMLPLHTSGICACTYHLFYNSESVGFLVALQAFLTVVGNTTLAFATLRLAKSNGWNGKQHLPAWAKEALTVESPGRRSSSSGRSSGSSSGMVNFGPLLGARTALAEALLLDGASLEPSSFSSSSLPRQGQRGEQQRRFDDDNDDLSGGEADDEAAEAAKTFLSMPLSDSFGGGSTPPNVLEDLGSALSMDSERIFLLKLFGLSLFASYVVKYGELFLDFPFADSASNSQQASAAVLPTAAVALTIVFVPTFLNMVKWQARSNDSGNGNDDDNAFDVF